MTTRDILLVLLLLLVVAHFFGLPWRLGGAIGFVLVLLLGLVLLGRL